MVISLFICVITSYSELTLYGLTKLGRMLNFIYIFIDMFEDGFYIYVYVHIQNTDAEVRFYLLKARKK